MSSISTHVLDTVKGCPASGIRVRLLRGRDEIGSGVTNADGRVPNLLPDGMGLATGVYCLVFETGAYFPDAFYPEVAITFTARDQISRYHVPLLISGFGYTTYRGS